MAAMASLLLLPSGGGRHSGRTPLAGFDAPEPVAGRGADRKQRRDARERNLEKQRLVAEEEQEASRQRQGCQHGPDTLAPDEGRQRHRRNGAQEERDERRLTKQTEKFGKKITRRPQHRQRGQKAHDRNAA